MRMSPARAHFLRKTAESETATATSKSLDGLKGYELMLATLNIHKRSLKQLQSIERRIEFKRKAFAEYQPWIEGALKAGTGVQDTVLMTMLVWAIDIDDFETALKIGKYALFHDLAMPEPFNRSTGCVIAEEIANKAAKAREQKAEFNPDILKQAYQLMIEHDVDMPDEAQAKLLRELAELIEETEPQTALDYYTRAIELDSNCGAKGLRNKLESRLNKLNKQQEQLEKQGENDSENANETPEDQAESTKG